MTIPAPSGVAQPDSPINVGYAVVPRGVLTDVRLSDRAVRLYALLDARTTGRPAVVKVETLAADIGATIRTTERALAELVRLGYVKRQRTRSVSVTAVDNPIRAAKKAQRSATGVGSDPTQVADTSRNNSLRNNNNRQHGASPALEATVPAPTSASKPVAGGHLEPYLRAVIEGAGVDIEPNRKVRGSLEKIAAAGVRPEQLRELVAGWPRISWSGEPIHRLSGFIVGVVLPGIAEGQKPPASRPETPLPSLPPTPEKLRELDRERELRETQDAALAESMDELLVLADQYGIKSPVRGAAAARAALRSAGVPA